MPTESVGRNYERNRENMTRRRRFKGITVETVNEGVAKNPAGLRRSRIDMPTRSAKSLNNLNLIENENGRDREQGNNADTGAGALLPLSRIIKWCKHISMVRGPPPQPAPEKASSVDQKPSPPPYHQSDIAEKRQGFTGPLGLGEYVDSMGGGFDELDPPNGFPQTQIKSRSLIDISMSNLWGSEKEEDSGEDLKLDNGDCLDKVQWSSISPEGRSNLLATISRLVPLPPSPPNLVQFMDSPTTSGNVYEDMETTFFGNSEDRWSTPAFVVTTFVQMQRGSLFNVHCVSDYIAELKLTINWAKSISHLIDGELRKYKSAERGKRQRQLALQGSYAKSENEAELVELRADFATFLNSSDAFIAHAKDTFRGGLVKVILIASHGRRLVSMKSLLPIQMPCALNEGRKTATTIYRKFLGEAPAIASISSIYRDQKGLLEVCAFLYTDCILLASKCPVPKASATATSTANTKSSARGAPILPRPMGVFETLVRHSLNFLSVTTAPSSPPCASFESATGPVVIKVIPPPPPPPVVPGSSSSGISSAASTGEEMEAGSENSSMVSGYEEMEQRLDFWWPLSNRYQLVFSEMRAYNVWRASLQSTMDRIQSCFTNQILRVKVQNAIAPEKCVHKYLALEPSITARELKEKAVTAWNISCQSTDAEIDVVFSDPIRGSLEIPLLDEDRPFLLALYITTLTGEETCDGTIDALATDQTDSGFTPGNLVFPLTPNRIPVTFVVRNSSVGVNSFRCPRIFVDQELAEPLKSIVDRPKSTLYPEANRGHRGPHLRGLSQSTHNLSATSAASAAASSGGSGGGKGRSRSRLRLHFSRGNLVFSGDDNDGDDKDPPSQQFGIFGRLPKEAWPDCRVSMSVMSLFVMIFYKGSLTQGIFRKSVQMSQLQAMIQRVDTNEDPLMEAECTPLCAANILKKYFSEIPGHLLMDEKWDNWIKITTLKTDEEIANYGRKMTRELPDINQSLLTFLLFTLAQVRVNQEVNKMSVDALSTVWGPNLLERPKAAPTVEDSALCASVVACLIGPFTDAYCLRSLEFRQKLSVFFDEIWGQMVPSVEGSTKPLPEGISILELPSINSEEITSSSSNHGLRSSRFLEPVQAKDRRNSWMIHSLSADESSHSCRPYLKTLKKDSKLFTSQEHGDLPPPIPPRNRRKSLSSSPLVPITIYPSASITTASKTSYDHIGTPPPLPARSFSPPQQIFHMSREQNLKANAQTRDIVSFSGTTVVDRRQSFSRRRRPSRSPVRSCTIDNSFRSRRSYMIGDTCEEDYASVNLESDDIPIDCSKPKFKTITATSLKRSTSDVDAHLQNKQITIRPKCQNFGSPSYSREMDFPWSTVAARRTSSRNHRCDTRWTCGLYSEMGGRNDLLDPPPPQNFSEPVTSNDSKPTGVRMRPTAIYLVDTSCLVLPSVQKTSPAPEVPAGICRRISSIIEQKKTTNEAGWKNWPPRADQLIPFIGTSTQLSRGSSHASTVSNTSATLGPPN